MKNFLKTFLLASLAAAVSACGVSGTGSAKTQENPGTSSVSLADIESRKALASNEMETLMRSLDEITELERAGSWLQGMAVTESSIREYAGDLPGAVAAAYKELALAYGRGLIQKQDKEQGLLKLLELKETPVLNDQSVAAAANAILAFSRGQWEQASTGLSLLFNNESEPDSFANWMLLVCALEKNRAQGFGEDRRASSAYRSIRARYSQFPEYWYRGAVAFSGTIAAEYAENCINSSPEGPFAEESRKIIAEFIGLKKEDGIAIRTKREIEAIITRSVSTGDPKMLDSLLPLISLPDNPYTIYAVGTFRALTNIPVFREYFTAQAAASRGRLAERLSYISRS
ncbi:MAG: hypothetical protein LBU88_08780 [Treponema sp.]|nr:hypothetical protein [Treponema sp.]